MFFSDPGITATEAMSRYASRIYNRDVDQSSVHERHGGGYTFQITDGSKWHKCLCVEKNGVYGWEVSLCQ